MNMYNFSVNLKCPHSAFNIASSLGLKVARIFLKILRRLGPLLLHRGIQNINTGVEKGTGLILNIAPDHKVEQPCNLVG